MIVDVGLFALMLAFGSALFAAVVSVLGGLYRRAAWVQSARNSAMVVFPLLTLSVLSVLYALYVLDFSLAYVADVSSQAMAPFFRLTALWGGQEGSVLFWAWMMAGFVMVLLLRKWESDREFMPYVIAISMLTTTFFIGVVVFITNPFDRLWHIPGTSQVITALRQPAGAVPFIPRDGKGLNPLLRHFGMIGHPPTTYLGFTGFVIPYAYAVAALVTGKSKGDGWIRTTRGWTLTAWIFLTIGLILGGRWAYDVLGWGGFWGWDPVENAMLMPWLTGTAFLHSVMMTEKRGMLKKWNMILIILTYSLSLFGTFITRTGIVSSVHAFTKSGLGPAFFVFIGLTFFGSLTLLFSRWETLKSERHIESVFSREAVFLLQNMLFIAITFAVFWGTMFPLISELFTGTKITVGPPYFKQVTGPLFGILLLLMGAAPLFAWRKQTLSRLGKAAAVPFLFSLVLAGIWSYAHRMHPGSYIALWLVTFVILAVLYEFWKGVRARVKVWGEPPLRALVKLIRRSHRRYGGYLIHLGVVMIAMGFIGDSYFKAETQDNLAVGERIQLNEYALQFEGLERYRDSGGREVLRASTRLFRNGEWVKDLYPRRDYYIVQQQPVTIPAIHSTLQGDLYVLLAGWEEVSPDASTFKIYLNPLVNWTWIGGLVMIGGTLIATWPFSRQKRDASYVIRDRTSLPAPEEERDRYV